MVIKADQEGKKFLAEVADVLLKTSGVKTLQGAMFLLQGVGVIEEENSKETPVVDIKEATENSPKK